jgi:hypothetical protein
MTGEPTLLVPFDVPTAERIPISKELIMGRFANHRAVVAAGLDTRTEATSTNTPSR